ncbi:glycosyltransferase family 4 protein [Rarobacter faecitabidus]|uniref:D-inositol 3-phosphate glycosyltransferase n=1 Tax=Rarobacter faecitabidus TaxID=13243 RepID=A0A542ZX75_RARFA|nr:glycosyltransferase family 4 protein [Rarobacter faecitabidus]TQL64945.1 phosphatidylinositol alpha-1,6-mannosyltransferase [Rarobacter faecitabidus]
MPRTLMITNDFPTRQGGIETFAEELAKRFDPDEIVVYTASMPGDAEYDRRAGFPVIRDRAGTLLPTRRVRKAVVRIMDEYSCDRVLFGAAAPLSLLSPALRKAGAKRIVAITHGHEAWWARIPVTAQLLRRMGNSVDALTYISIWCRDQISRALSPAGRDRQLRLAPGVDPGRFYPGVGARDAFASLGLADGTPIVLVTGRLVARKGQDTLIEAWPAVLASAPEARLVIVGKGPDEAKLRKLAATLHVEDAVIFAGSVPWADLPGYYDACTLFAMPSRTRKGGLEVEGLGIVYLEAGACGKPVVVGDSGGAPDAVVDGETGFLVDPRDPADVAAKIVDLLQNPELAARMGSAGRARVERDWTWDQVAATCKGYLGL